MATDVERQAISGWQHTMQVDQISTSISVALTGLIAEQVSRVVSAHPKTFRRVGTATPAT